MKILLESEQTIEEIEYEEDLKFLRDCSIRFTQNADNTTTVPTQNISLFDVEAIEVLRILDENGYIIKVTNVCVVDGMRMWLK